ncbi:1,5-anhydro-D-fructose reductase [Nonomuraea coxensis DSM 45129]|uniref:1,5-anhydro-D-fructose reductase n=1 Tax=Nonomuraea coxensis DSM 45129 TaxID=1122611 RepID=A0ABX8TTT8_9ACTN|nr:Gfo/Idh/MocA family oxidoreductase [Nonomuraea coxensis]QYC38885.1 1,5-anhydro-D-fructose reductase [Nonomuraea coxensis DSM 45129]
MNQQVIRLGIIGLGAMGSEMLGIATGHPEFETVLTADPVRLAPDGVPHTPDAQRVIDHPDIDAVYIASPPSTHAGYAVQAMKAGKAVFCEKPLAIDLDEGAEMVSVAAELGSVNALNFVLSDRAAAVEVGRALRAGEAGTVLGVEVRLLFPEWPRAFQRAAGWVAGREQGGFLREVASHFLFLTDRLLGPLTRSHAQITYGPAAETAADVLLTAADAVPVRVSGQVAAGPESYEWTLYGSRASYRITEWGRLFEGDGSGWREVTLDGPRGDEQTRLTEFARAVRGEQTTLADFSAGLRVQRLIEGFHL